MSRIKSGGGLTSNKLVNVGVKSGPPRTNIVSPASASQLGQSVPFKRDPLPIGTGAQVPMGNAVALNVGKGGPGAGRTTHPCGSQGTHGPTVAGEPRQPGAADRGPRSILGPKGS
jgi:hypothetical protein